MERDVIFASQHIIITKQHDGYYIESFRNGMSIEQFNKLMIEHPEIRITSFMTIKTALLAAPRPPARFGEVKERVFVEVSADELRAYVTLAVMESEFTNEKKIVLVKEILQKLNDKGIIFGIKKDVLINNLCNGKQILIAEGIPPENGQDSTIRLYQLKEVKPELKEDGNVDHYELNLINKVAPGEWLGERVDPGDGVPGKSVKGNAILALKGKKYPLFYDKNSVKEVSENGITTLYSTRAGAVHFDGERIGVSNHLEITGNIDFRTGNVDFDGYLTVKGTIEDNFSVAANKDVEILGDYGIGSVKEIISKEGSIYIKGGIAGKNKALVKSKKNIYTKFVSDATIICDGSVHIGFYCLNSHIIAKEVILDSTKAQIIGGNIQAEIRVVSSIVGSASEKRTSISIKGFERNSLMQKLEKLVIAIEEFRNSMAKVKQELAIYLNTPELTREQKNTYDTVRERYTLLRDELKELEDERKALVSYLRAYGEGEIRILKKAYPGTVLEIKRIKKELDKSILKTTFYFCDGELVEL